MKTTFDGTMQPLDTSIPDPALIVLIGAAGSGKSTWPSTQVPWSSISSGRWSRTTSLSSSAC